MGLSGSGKTTLSKKLCGALTENNKSFEWFNADEVRKKYHDWDFSIDGRIRQARRMRELADNSGAEFVICDLIAPLKSMRDILDADYTIWMDTVERSNYNNTDAIFERPTDYTIRVTEKDVNAWSPIVYDAIINNNLVSYAI
jgi:adenylylsulfate kinase